MPSPYRLATTKVNGATDSRQGGFLSRSPRRCDQGPRLGPGPGPEVADLDLDGHGPCRLMGPEIAALDGAMPVKVSPQGVILTSSGQIRLQA